MEEITIKHRQHYVFQAYLKNWAINDQIWCCRNRSKVFLTNTVNVAQERDFYRLKDLNADEYRFILLFISRQPPHIVDIVKKQIALYHTPIYWQQKVIKTNGLIKSLFGKDIINNPQIAEILSFTEKFAESAVNDMVEDMYCIDEGIATKVFEDIKEGKLDFYYNPSDSTGNDFDNTKRSFLNFLCSQHFRTRAMKKRWESAMSAALDEKTCNGLKINKNNIRFDHLSFHIFWYIEAQLTDSLYNRNAHLTLLRNNTSVPFLTSDQPIINVLAKYDDIQNEVSDLVFYYPITPQIAITVNDDNTLDKIELSLSEVKRYNELMCTASHELIFASSQEQVEQYINT